MENISQISLTAVFLPFFYAVWLLVSRLRLKSTDKKVLTYGLSVINLFSLIVFSGMLIFKKSLNLSYSFLNFENLSFDFGFKIDSSNLKMLVYSALTYFLVSVFAKIYFTKKKQFLFTKQRFYVFLSLLVFNTYLYLCSYTLFQMLVFQVLQGIIIFCFAYFDIFKNHTGFNVQRFHRIALVGDFSFLLLCLILVKYVLNSDNFIINSSLNIDELNVLFGFIYGCATYTDLNLFTVAVFLVVASRLLLFPFGCYYGFFANSSGLLYLSVLTCANNILGLYFLTNSISYFELLEINPYIGIYCLISALSGAIFILFEKNLKIIFGYIISIVNSIFVYLILTNAQNPPLIPYFVLNIVIFGVLVPLVLFDKMSLKRILTTKRKGFIPEKMHIFFFETLLYKLQKIVDFIDSKIIQNTLVSVFNLFSGFAFVFANKTRETSVMRNSGNVIIIFVIVLLFAIVAALFRGF